MRKVSSINQLAYANYSI